MSSPSSIKLQIVHPKSQVGEMICPFCLDPLEVGQAVVVCPECTTIHHTLCWQENNDACAVSHGCSGVGEVDWVAPLHVKQSESVRAAIVSEPLADVMASTLGLQAIKVENTPLSRALITDIAPTYIIALHQFVFVIGLVAISKGQVLENSLIQWQHGLISQTWLWLLTWVVLVLLLGLLNILRGNPRWRVLGTGVSLLVGLGLWLMMAPLVVEVFFIPQYLWPGSVGKLFLYFGWGRILLAIAMSIPVFYILVLAIIFASSIPRAILGGLNAILIDFGKILFGLIGLGLIAWGGIIVGASFLGWVSGQTWIMAVLLQNGLTIVANVSFIILVVLITYVTLIMAFRQAVERKQRQKELTNA